MIGVYAICDVPSSNQAEFEALAKEFIQESRTHRGCVHYNCGKVSGHSTRYAFIEQWQTQADLDAHLSTPFFQAHAPDLIELTQNGLDINSVNLLA